MYIHFGIEFSYNCFDIYLLDQVGLDTGIRLDIWLDDSLASGKSKKTYFFKNRIKKNLPQKPKYLAGY